MRREDFFTGGEPLDSSPPITMNEAVSYNEAVENAGFGKYDYDPGMRLMSQPVSLFPGGYGYNNPQFMNPPVGIGSNPYMPMNYNPALYYQQQVQQQPQVPTTYHIPALNFSGSDYLPPINFEEDIEKLKLDAWMKKEEQDAQQSVNRSNNGIYSGYGYNYYGVPFYNPYQYNSINSEIMQKVNEMQNEARENRIALNIQLSKLAHNVAGETYDESLLEERYRGKTVPIPGAPKTQLELYEQTRFSNLVEFDNSQFYRNHDMAVSREYNAIIPKNANMEECFKNMGIVYAQYEMEEEQHRRRNGATLYDSDNDSYRYFVRSKAAERYAKKNGIPVPGVQNTPENFKQNMLNSFSTLSQSAKICEDGTLNITCNFGSHAGETYTVRNSEEAGYEKDRERFQSFLNSIPGSIYTPDPNGGGV